MGHEIMAVSRLAGGHLRKKILSGALTGQNYFAVLTRTGFHGTPSAGHLVPPSRRSGHPIRRRHRFPPSPWQGNSKHPAVPALEPDKGPGPRGKASAARGPRPGKQRNTKRRPLRSSRLTNCVAIQCHYLVKSNFILTAAPGAPPWGTAGPGGRSGRRLGVRPPKPAPEAAGFGGRPRLRGRARS